MDHRLIAEDTRFPLSAHPFRDQSPPTDELIEALKRALRYVAALPPNVSPMVEIAHRALAACEELSGPNRLTAITEHVARRLRVDAKQLTVSRTRTQHVAF